MRSAIAKHSEMFDVCGLNINYILPGFEPAESPEKGFVGRTSQIPAK